MREITRIAVLDRQLPAALDHNHAALVCALVFEHMTVQVQRHGAVDGQGVADANVPCQLDGADSRICNRRSQGRLVADFCYRSARGGRLARAAQRCQGRLRLGVGHFPLRLFFVLFAFRLCVLNGLAAFAVFRQSALCAADGTICVHCFCCAGRFAGAYRRFFRLALGKCRGRHKAEHHAQSKQDTE